MIRVREAKSPRYQHWSKKHDGRERPKGCNGRYGGSGLMAHRTRGEKPCQPCKDSYNHQRREAYRGQPTPRVLQPCGTPAAARRHRARGEPLCLRCKLAEAAQAQERRDRAKLEAHQSNPMN